MNGPDAFSDELLSAYLDGELSDEQRGYVERMLDQNPELRGKYRAFCGLNDRLRDLKRYELNRQASRRLLDAIEDVAHTGSTDWGTDEATGALLSAYVDGEVSDGERELVELHCEEDESQRRRVEELRELGELFAALPVYRLDDGFADRVVQQLESASSPAPSDSDAPADLVTVAGTEPRRRSTAAGVRGVIWAAAAIATAVLLMLFAQNNDSRRDGSRFAQSDPVTTRETSPDSGSNPSTAEPGPKGVDSQLVIGAQEGQIPTPAPPKVAIPLDSPFTMVSSMRRTRLVLVYEIAVTGEGVQNAAFSNLLRRHRIGFNETLAISREEQKDLLAQRFLDNVQVVDEQRDQMDRVDLYLVSTTALTAEALYMDLMSRPTGIGGFALNLTTRDAQARVLNRLCESSGIEDNVGEAVRLLANFGVLSSTARNVGAFGTLRWVDPSLYQPSQPATRPTPGESSPREEGAAPAMAARGGAVQKPPAVPQDFSCELLFVVRQWGVAPDAPSAGGGGK